MTKYILHGGYMGRENDQNKMFFSEVTKDLKNGDKVLVVGFARNSEEYDKILERDKVNVLNSSNGKNLEVLWADENNFMDQVKDSGAIIIEGGDTLQLFTVLKKFPDFLNFLDGKTIAGSSAGAYVLSKYYYSNSADKIFEGLGAVPIRILCHYEGNEDAIKIMNKYPSEFELVVLKDHEHKIVKK